MAVELNVKVEMNDIAKRFPTLWKKIPKFAANSLNETAVFVRTRAITNIATRLKLPRKLVAKRVGLDGWVKEDRMVLIRARAGNLTAVLSTYARGIPVILVAGAQTHKRGGRFKKGGGRHAAAGGGTKARGGRFYEGAFYAWIRKGGRRMVLKRGSKPGSKGRPDRNKAFAPKIGVREQLDREVTHLFEQQGRARFRHVMERRLQFELTR